MFESTTQIIGIWFKCASYIAVEFWFALKIMIQSATLLDALCDSLRKPSKHFCIFLYLGFVKITARLFSAKFFRVSFDRAACERTAALAAPSKPEVNPFGGVHPSMGAPFWGLGITGGSSERRVWPNSHFSFRTFF